MNIRTAVTHEAQKGWIAAGTARTTLGKTYRVELTLKNKIDRSEAIRMLQKEFAASAKRDKVTFL